MEEGDKPWGPAVDLQHFFVTHTLKIVVLLGLAGFLNAVLSFQAASSLGLLFTGLGGLITFYFHRIRKKGLVNYMPQAMQKMLLETTFLDWLLDGSFAEKLRPYFILMMDLNAEEQQYLIRSMPRYEQELLLSRGMIHLLPEAVQSFLLPLGLRLQRRYQRLGVSNILQGGVLSLPVATSVQDQDTPQLEDDDSDTSDEEDERGSETTGHGEHLHATTAPSGPRMSPARPVNITSPVAGHSGVPRGQQGSRTHGAAFCNPQTPDTILRQQQQHGQPKPAQATAGRPSLTWSPSTEHRAVNRPRRKSNQFVLLRANSSVHQLSPPEEVGDAPRYVMQKRLLRGWLEVNEWQQKFMRQRLAHNMGDSRILWGTALVTGAALAGQLTTSSTARKVVKSTAVTATTLGSLALCATFLSLAVFKHIYTQEEEEEVEEEKEREHFRMRARSLEEALLRSSWFKDKRARRSPYLSAAQVGAFFLLLALWRSGRLHQLISRVRSAHQLFPPSRLLAGKMGV